MRKACSLITTFVLTLPLLPGCAGSSNTTADRSADPTTADQSPISAAPVADAVPILAKITGQELPISNPMLGRVNADAVSKLDLPERFADNGFELNLDQHSVILLSLGEQATGGYAADIIALQRSGDELFVQGTATAPAEQTAATQAKTYPFAAVVVDKLPSNIMIRSDITSLQR